MPDLSPSTSQIAGITGVCHQAQLSLQGLILTLYLIWKGVMILFHEPLNYVLRILQVSFYPVPLMVWSEEAI